MGRLNNTHFSCFLNTFWARIGRAVADCCYIITFHQSSVLMLNRFILLHVLLQELHFFIIIENHFYFGCGSFQFLKLDVSSVIRMRCWRTWGCHLWKSMWTCIATCRWCTSENHRVWAGVLSSSFIFPQEWHGHLPVATLLKHHRGRTQQKTLY